MLSDKSERKSRNPKKKLADKLTKEANSKEHIKSVILKIFLHYATFSLKDFDLYITYTQFYKIIQIAGIPIQESLDLIIKKIVAVGSKLSFDQFREIILNIAYELDPEALKERPHHVIQLFVKTYFQGHYNKIINGCFKTNSYYEIERKINKIFIEDHLQEEFEEIKPIKQIYFHYFKYEISGYQDLQKIKRNSLLTLIEFCKAYELVPFSFKPEEITIYYYLIIGEEDKNSENKYCEGTIFTYSKFCRTLLILGIEVVNKFLRNSHNFSILTNEEKIRKFLEKLNISNGTANLAKKHHLTMNLSTSDLRSKKDSMLCSKENWINMSVKDFSRPRTMLLSTHCETTSFENKSILSNIEIRNKFEKYHPILKKVFNYYTNVTDKLQFTQMSLSDYLKFLRDFGLVKSKMTKAMITENEYEIIFKEICGSTYLKTKNNSVFESKSSLKGTDENESIVNKMNYSKFLQAIDAIAKILFKNSENSIAMFFGFIDDKINAFEKRQKEKDILESQITVIQNSEICPILNKLYPIMFHYFSGYSYKGLLTFDKYVRMAKDFGLFPDMVSLVTLKNLFFALIELSEEEETEESKEKGIPFDFFMISLGILGLNLNNSLSQVEKVLLLFEQISQTLHRGTSLSTKGETFSSKKELCRTVLELKQKYVPSPKKKYYEMVLSDTEYLDKVL